MPPMSPLLRHFLEGLAFSLLGSGAVFAAGFLTEHAVFDAAVTALVTGVCLLVSKFARDRQELKAQQKHVDRPE